MSDLELGRENNTDEGTQLDCSDGYEAAVGLVVLMTDETPGQRTAITGDSQTAAGGIGISGAGAATGVLGLGGTTGVSGQGGQDGVLGTTTVTNGVRGLALGFGIGVLGENVSNAPNGAGVKGTSRMGDAVWGWDDSQGAFCSE